MREDHIKKDQELKSGPHAKSGQYTRSTSPGENIDERASKHVVDASDSADDLGTPYLSQRETRRRKRR